MSHVDRARSITTSSRDTQMAALPFRMVPSLTILLNWCSTTWGKWTDCWPLWSSPVVVAPGNHPRGTGSSVMRRCRRQWELLHYSWDTRYVSTRRFSCLWPEKFSPLKYFHRCTEQRKLKHVKNTLLHCRTVKHQNTFTQNFYYFYRENFSIYIWMHSVNICGEWLQANKHTCAQCGFTRLGWSCSHLNVIESKYEMSVR